MTFLRDAILTHFVTLIGKWTIVGGLVKNWADKRSKVAKLKYKSFFTSLERADKKTVCVDKKLIGTHRPIADKRDKVGMDGVPSLCFQS